MDEFDAYDLSEFTEQDLRDLDARLASPLVHAAKKHLAVTDLVSPLWCEVQFEYKLFGHHNKPIHLRAPVFTSRRGKQIHVQQHVAQANDRRLKRGKSVHRALEHELRPEKVVVHVVSNEERFGLRLVQLIDGFTQLVTDGITRELPVFTITHDQVVLGVIDEVLCVPPSSPPHKKRQWAHELCIRDYKTRRAETIPLDQDSLSPRLQLMLYHRMLASLLQPETFDFHQLWNRLDLDPTKPFSTQFSNDILWEQRRVDPAHDHAHLNHLVSLWISTIRQQCPEIPTVSPQLQLVYHRSVWPRQQHSEKASGPVDMEALALQEELDLARAIEESLSEMSHQVGQVALHVTQSVEQAGPSSTSTVWTDLVSPQTDPSLSWALEQSLLTCAPSSPRTPATHGPHTPPNDETESGATPEEDAHDHVSPVLGTKQFTMDDKELDTHLADVLQWWLGVRPARGVDVAQTNRCFTCEYQDSCEWRERKAKEAAALASERRAQQTRTNNSSIWPITAQMKH